MEHKLQANTTAKHAKSCSLSAAAFVVFHTVKCVFNPKTDKIALTVWLRLALYGPARPLFELAIGKSRVHH